MAKENKTKETEITVDSFYQTIDDEKRRNECKVIEKMMKKASGKQGKMWGPSIVGFGNYRYKYESGRENDWFYAGFSPRKANLTIYLMAGPEKFPDILKRLGKYKISGGSCLYVKKLEDVDTKVLEELITASIKQMKEKHG